MRRQWLFGSVAVVALAMLLGCGGDKKDDAGSAPVDRKDKQPPGGGDPQPTPGEPKFKLDAAEFVSEYAKNSRAADTKYAGSIVELKGTVIRPAGLETGPFGTPVGGPGSYKAMLLFGAEDAKRAETVEVKGLKTSVVGTIFHRQQVRVKGKVAHRQDPNPVELLDSEVVDAGADPSIPLDFKKMYPPTGREYAKQFENAPARVSGLVLNRGKDIIDYVTLRLDSGDQLRCYLLEGTEALIPSVFKERETVVLVGMLKMDSIDKGTPFATRKHVLRESVPLSPPVKPK